MLLNLVKAADVQGDLFDVPDDPKAVARMKALDSLKTASPATTFH